MLWGEKWRADTNLEFSSTFHLLVLTHASLLGLSSPLLPPGIGETSRVFLVIFNYPSHSSMIGWPITSALAWNTQWLAGRSCRLSVCFSFFVFYSSCSPSLEIYLLSFSNFSISYHVTLIVLLSHFLLDSIELRGCFYANTAHKFFKIWISEVVCTSNHSEYVSTIIRNIFPSQGPT